jgi:hypothetical protein
MPAGGWLGKVCPPDGSAGASDRHDQEAVPIRGGPPGSVCDGAGHLPRLSALGVRGRDQLRAQSVDVGSPASVHARQPPSIDVTFV